MSVSIGRVTVTTVTIDLHKSKEAERDLLIQEMHKTLESEKERSLKDIFDAVDKGDEKGLEQLIKANRSLVNERLNDWNSGAPLHRAAKVSAAVTRVLLDAEADPFMKWGVDSSEGNRTALHEAVSQNKPEVVRLLAQRVPKLVDMTNGHNYTALDLAIGLEEKESEELCDILLKEDAKVLDWNGSDEALCKKESALHKAVQKGFSSICTKLLKAHANVNSLDDEGRTPLHVAAIFGRAEICKILLKAGAEIEIRDKDGKTALHCAANAHSANVCEELLNAGADIIAKNKGKRIPLEVAQGRKLGKPWGKEEWTKAEVNDFERNKAETIKLLAANTPSAMCRLFNAICCCCGKRTKKQIIVTDIAREALLKQKSD